MPQARVFETHYSDKSDLLSGHRMVLMHNPPSPFNLSEAHGQSKFHSFVLAAAVEACAPSYRRGKRHIVPRGDSVTVYLSDSLSRDASFCEMELRTNTTITAHTITGYEFNYSTCSTSASPNAGIVRWNGALNDFTDGIISLSSPPQLVNGDTLCLIRNGSTLSITRNGTTLGSTSAANANTYTNGSPGIGQEVGPGSGVVGDNALFGWSSFTGSDGTSSGNITTASCNSADVQNALTERVAAGYGIADVSQEQFARIPFVSKSFVLGQQNQYR